MNVLVKFESGSGLYGTKRPESDTDYFAVYRESLKNIILGKDKGTIQEKTNQEQRRNNSEDTDTTFKELRAFIKEGLEGQSMAIEALFVPREMWEVVTPLWVSIVNHRDKLIGNLYPIASYCRKQARKYSDKAKRYTSLERCLSYWEIVTKDSPNNTKLSEFLPYEDEYCYYETRQGLTGDELFYVTAGVAYQPGVNVKYMLNNLRKKVQEYGIRAKQASVDGNDWKAYSHALRLAYEYIDLCEKGVLTFPLENGDHLRNVKQGLVPLPQVEEELEGLFDKMENLSYTNSADENFWENWLVDVYTGKYNPRF